MYDVYHKKYTIGFVFERVLAYNIYCVGETDGQISPKLGCELVDLDESRK
jgi:hypothetical protein